MKNRVIWKMLALTIITIGIYRLYWFIKTRKEMMQLNPNVKIMNPLFLVIPVLLIVASFGYLFADIYNRDQSVRDSGLPYCTTSSAIYKESRGDYSGGTEENCQIAETDTSPLPIILVYVSFILFWPLVAVWLWGYSKGVEAVTKGKTNFAIAMIVLLAVPDGIDILIIQDGFNKLSPPKPA